MPIKYGIPQIINSDQGSQYTSAMWINYLENLNIKISMAGKGRALDNVWIERFWKSLKHDYIYINPYDDGFETYERVQNHIEYYNEKIHHTTKEKSRLRYFKSFENQAA